MSTKYGTIRLPLLTKICLLDRLIIEQHLRIAGLYDPSGLKHIRAVRDRERFLRVLLNEEHGRARFVQALDDIKNFIYKNRRKSHRRLVKQHDLRL